MLDFFCLSTFPTIFTRFRRSTHVTPKTYLSFLASYKSVFSTKADEIGRSTGRIETGLSKLEEASQTVERLKSDLAVMERELALASETAENVYWLFTDDI